MTFLKVHINSQILNIRKFPNKKKVSLAPSFFQKTIQLFGWKLEEIN